MTKLVSIHSFGYCTDKTEIVANLAAQIAIKGKRVAIVDADMQFPEIHVLFGLDNASIEHTLNDFLRGEVRIRDAAIDLGDVPSNLEGIKKLRGRDLWLVSASLKGSEISQILKNGYDVNMMNDGIAQLCEELYLDYLFINTNPGLNEETLLTIVISDILIIILRPNQLDFQGTAVLVDIGKSLDVPVMHLVINKYLTKYDPVQIKELVESTYETNVAGLLPLSEDLAENQSADIFSLAYPDHIWSKEIMKVTEELS